MLGIMIQQQSEIRHIQEGKELFIDRNGPIFEYVLEYLRNGDNMVLPHNKETLQKLLLEADFYQIPTLKNLILSKTNISAKFKVGDYVKLENPMDVMLPDKDCQHGFGSYHRKVHDMKHIKHLDDWIGIVVNSLDQCLIVKFHCKMENFREMSTVLHVPVPEVALKYL